jgi:predicted transcriptional regulator
MTTEDKLKDLILKRYHSVREFTIENDIPYTTIHSIFKRGIGNSSVSNIIKICKALGISADALADGEISPIKNRPVSEDSKLDINEILDDTKNLIHYGEITLDGKPIGKAGIESIIDAIDVGVEIAKKKSQQKP